MVQTVIGGLALWLASGFALATLAGIAGVMRSKRRAKAQRMTNDRVEERARRLYDAANRAS